MRPDKDVMKYLAMVTQVGISMLAPIVLCVSADAADIGNPRRWKKHLDSSAGHDKARRRKKA